MASLLMPVAGLEPARCYPHDFESCASANSATPALHVATKDMLPFFSSNVNNFPFPGNKKEMPKTSPCMYLPSDQPITFFTASSTRSA